MKSVGSPSSSALPSPWQAGAATERRASAVPPLTELALDKLAEHPDAIVSLRCVADHLLVGLLYRIMQRGKLDYRLACVFRDAGHDEITEAIAGLDLLAGMPTFNAESKHCGYR